MFGVGFVCFDFVVGGINVLYMYFCVIEVFFVMEGVLYMGFVIIVNCFFVIMFYKGDVFIFF